MTNTKVTVTIIILSTLLFIAFINLQIGNIQIISGSTQYDSINVSKVVTMEKTVEFKEVELPLFFRYINDTFNNGEKMVKYPFGILEKHPTVLLEGAPREINVEADLNSTEKKSFKKIIFWNEFNKKKHFGYGFGRKPFLIGNCRYNNCFTTGQKDRFSLNETDALLWHFKSTDKSLPEIRYPNAQYIFYMHESASRSRLFGNLNDFNNVFDLTFTYRRDSDIPNPYSVIAQRDSSEDYYVTQDFNGGKTKIATWFVSNCRSIPSGRDLLAEGLKKYIKIDIYGKCGSLQCSRNTTNGCYEMAAKKYFFYLAFENSLCKDYITEKFFHALKYDFVPVVYGSGPYWKHAPPHSYIDVFDFPSIKDLAKYLIHLSKTPYEYNQYFRWKANYFVLPTYTRSILTLCKLCEVLNTQKPSNKSRYDLQDWFVHQSDCKDGNSPFISDFLNGQKLNSSYNQFRCKDNPKNCYGTL